MMQQTARSKVTLLSFGRAAVETQGDPRLGPGTVTLEMMDAATLATVLAPSAGLTVVSGRTDAIEANMATMNSTISGFGLHLINVSNPHVVTATQVGLGNVNNTSDASKPISTLEQAALDTLTAADASHSAAVTGVHGVSGNVVGTGNSQNLTNKTLTSPAIVSPTFSGTPTGLTKANVGLGNVDNTSDASKPLSTAETTALAGKAATSHTHAASDIVSGTVAIANLPTGTTSTTLATGNRANPTGGTAGQVLTKNTSTDYDYAWSSGYTTPSPVIVNDSTSASYSSGNVDLITSSITLPSGGKWLVQATGTLRMEGSTTGGSIFTLNALIGGTGNATPNYVVEQGVDTQTDVLYAAIITGTGAAVPVIFRWTWVSGTMNRYTCRLVITATPV